MRQQKLPLSGERLPISQAEMALTNMRIILMNSSKKVVENVPAPDDQWVDKGKEERGLIDPKKLRRMRRHESHRPTFNIDSPREVELHNNFRNFARRNRIPYKQAFILLLEGLYQEMHDGRLPPEDFED